jgi:hypothetical protein
MTRSASQRYTERQKKVRRTQEEERAVASPPPSRSWVGSTIRFARSYEFSPHNTGGVFASCVFHSHHVRSFPSSLLLRSRHDSSTDDAAGADQGSAAEGFFATGRISGRLLESISDRKDLSRRNRATGSPERYVDRHRFVTSLRVRSSQTRDFLSSGSFRPLLLFFPDDGERFPRRRVSRACAPKTGRGGSKPRRDGRTDAETVAAPGFLSSRARVRRANAHALVSSEAIANTRNAHVRYLPS